MKREQIRAMWAKKHKKIDNTKCRQCHGRGWYMGDDGIGGWDQLDCKICGGTGKR